MSFFLYIILPSIILPIIFYDKWNRPPDALTCRRGLLRQNPYLCPAVSVASGLITAKSLSVPRYPGIDGAYYGKILICAPMYKGGGYNRPGLVSHTRVCEGRWVYSTWFYLTYPRPWKSVGIIDLILSHIPASVKVGGYNRPGLVSHTRVRESRWV